MNIIWTAAAFVYALLLNGIIGRKRGSYGVKIMCESESFVFAVLTVLSLIFGSGALSLCFGAGTAVLIIGYLKKSSFVGFCK